MPKQQQQPTSTTTIVNNYRTEPTRTKPIIGHDNNSSEYNSLYKIIMKQS